MDDPSQPPRSRAGRHALLSALLLVALLVLVGLLLALLGSLVSIPQGGVVVVGALALAAFLGLQALVFRSLGLRSRADDAAARRAARAEGDAASEVGDLADGAADDAEESDDDADWRAWRG